MNKFLNFLKEKQHIIIFFVLFAVLIGNCNSCKREKQCIVLQKTTNDTLNQFRNDFKNITITAKEMELMLAIERYRTSFNVVYDNNTIVRTVERPDDVMNKYTKEIEKLIKELDDLKNNKK